MDLNWIHATRLQKQKEKIKSQAMKTKGTLGEIAKKWTKYLVTGQK